MEYKDDLGVGNCDLTKMKIYTDKTEHKNAEGIMREFEEWHEKFTMENHQFPSFKHYVDWIPSAYRKHSHADIVRAFDEFIEELPPAPQALNKDAVKIYAERFIAKYSLARYCEGMKKAIDADVFHIRKDGKAFDAGGNLVLRCRYCPEGKDCISNKQGERE